MRNSIKISAVIPTFNREKTVGRAIESALAQEFPVSEIIVVDDGSKDGTRSIVESYGAKCRYVYQENSGVSAARNRGVREAGGDWIAFLDSDDYWFPQHLSRLADAIEATNGEAALYFCDIRRPSGEGEVSHWDSIGFGIDAPYVLKSDASPWAMRPVQPMLLQASLIKRASYWDVGGLPPELRTREDTLLFYKLGLQHPACAVSGCGTVMTSDGALRLTREMGSAGDPYWQATLTIYRELLSIAARSRPEYRRYFLQRLSATYFSLGRLRYREKKPIALLKNLLRSAGESPSMFVKCLMESLHSRAAEK
jgi:hypothetical protein